jgi:hypothetical protein
MTTTKTEHYGLSALLDDVRNKRDEELTERARASFERDMKLEQDATLAGIVVREAELLGVYLINYEKITKKLRRRLARSAFLGKQTRLKRPQKHTPERRSGNSLEITTPLLLPTEPETDGEFEVVHGFKVIVNTLPQVTATNRGESSWVVSAIDVLGVQKEVESGRERVSSHYFRVPVLDDSNEHTGKHKRLELSSIEWQGEERLMEQYSILHAARIALGEPGVK